MGILDYVPGIAATVGGLALDVVNPAIGVPLTAGGLAMLGGEDANVTNRNIATNATNSNIQQANAQMQFQQYMSNTAYQRAVADMRAAGINPMLAGTNQSPASSPMGAAGRAETARMDNVIGAGVNSALSAGQLKNAIEVGGSQIALNNAAAAKATADANTSAFSAKNYDLRNKALASQLQSIKDQADVASARAAYDKKAALFDAINNRASTAAGTAANLSKLWKLFGSDGEFFHPPKGTGTFDLNTGEVTHENW